jgi:16S rRNA G966 N2-methylase RsmD
MHDHLSAAAANVTAPGAAPFVERAAHYDNLSPQTAARLEAMGREATLRLLTEFNRQALDVLESNDRELESAPETPRRRLNLGLYLFVENDTAGEQP